MFLESPIDVNNYLKNYIYAELKEKSSSSFNTQKSYPPIESGRYINWFSSTLRVVTFFNEPIKGRNNKQFFILN